MNNARIASGIALVGLILVGAGVYVRSRIAPTGTAASSPAKSVPVVTQSASVEEAVATGDHDVSGRVLTVDPMALLAASETGLLFKHEIRPIDAFMKALSETHRLLGMMGEDERQTYAVRMASIARDSGEGYFRRELAVWSLWMMRKDPGASGALRSLTLSIGVDSSTQDLNLLPAATFALGLKPNRPVRKGRFEVSWESILYRSNTERAFRVHPPASGVSTTESTPEPTLFLLVLRPSCHVKDPEVRRHVLDLLRSKDVRARDVALDVLPILEPNEAVLHEMRMLMDAGQVGPDLGKALVGSLANRSNPNRVRDLRRVLSISVDEEILKLADSELPIGEGKAAVALVHARARDFSNGSIHRQTFVRVLSKIAYPNETRRRVLEEFVCDADLGVANVALREVSRRFRYNRFAEIAHAVLARRNPADPRTRELLSLLNRQSGGAGERYVRSIARDHPDPGIRRLALRVSSGK